jgi:HPt (histidine-containing phosphotransfer) domain-containing protein
MNEAREEKVAAARARMAELTAKFSARSVRDLAAMRDGLARLNAGQIDALGDIRHLAHRMCGTGATLGFEALSDCAARVEQLTESCPVGTLPDPAARMQLGIGIEVLGAELARLAPADTLPPGT